MTVDSQRQTLSLRDAIIAWCDPALVEEVRAAEAGFSRESLVAMGFARLDTDEGSRKREPRGGRDGPSRHWLDRGWRALHRDLQDRMENGLLYLAGVPTLPDRHQVQEAIPGIWATDYEIRPLEGIVSGVGRRWIAVRASTAPISAAEAKGNGLRTEITSATVVDLSDDEILILLEEHANRVIANTDAKLLDAFKIKVSMMPIIRRKMQLRANEGETLPTLGKETQALRDWIATKIPSHQVPTAKSIANAISSDYRRPKA